MKNTSAWKDTVAQDSIVENAFMPDTLDAKHMAEIIVTATRTEKAIDDVGRSVSVISSGDIKKSGANSVAELLSLTEGIYISGTQQNFGSNQSIFIRGANSNQSVIMIDGIPITDPSTPTNALDLSELSLMDVDRMEIVRGSHSTMYGSSAIGGVVNIITSKKQKQGLNVNASGTAGAFGKGTSLISENIAMNYTCKGGFYTNLNFNNSNVNGMDATVDTFTVEGMPRDMDGMNRFDYGGKIGYRFNRLDLSFTTRNTEKSSDIDDREFDDDDNYKLDFERKSIFYSATCRMDSGFFVSLNGGNSSMTRTAVNDSSLIDNTDYDHSYYKGVYTGATSTGELQLHIKRKGWSLVLGGGVNDQLMNQDIYSYYYGGEWKSSLDTLNLVSHTNSFFLLTELNGSLISEKAKAFSLSLGARNNHNNTFGSSVTYQVNPMIKVSETSSVYANFSSGYNAPSLYQLHSPDKEFMSTLTRGNVNLRPETSVTQEFGVYQKINDKTGVRIGYYQTVVKDIIEYVYIWNKNTPVNMLTFYDYMGDTYLNLGTLRTEGIELEAHGAIGKKLLVSGNFSYLRGKQLSSYEGIDTVKTAGNHVQLYSNGNFVSVKDVHSIGLTRRPVTAVISLGYSPGSKVFFKSIMKYVSSRNDIIYDYKLGPYGALGKIPVQAYTLVDLISGVKFNENFSGLIRIENVFNVSYSEIRGFSSRGRGYYFTINYTL